MVQNLTQDLNLRNSLIDAYDKIIEISNNYEKLKTISEKSLILLHDVIGFLHNSNDEVLKLEEEIQKTHYKALLRALYINELAGNKKTFNFLAISFEILQKFENILDPEQVKSYILSYNVFRKNNLDNLLKLDILNITVSLCNIAIKKYITKSTDIDYRVLETIQKIFQDAIETSKSANIILSVKLFDNLMSNFTICLKRISQKLSLNNVSIEELKNITSLKLKIFKSAKELAPPASSYMQTIDDEITKTTNDLREIISKIISQKKEPLPNQKTWTAQIQDPIKYKRNLELFLSGVDGKGIKHLDVDGRRLFNQQNKYIKLFERPEKSKSGEIISK